MMRQLPSSGKTVWIINPYGTLPSESWATYRSTMLAKALAAAGYSVTQFISNFEHRSKTFRASAYAVEIISPNYSVHIVPSCRYDAHISLRRIQYERTFARNLLHALAPGDRPEFLILAEPALFYYDILEDRLLRRTPVVILDVIDLWPELFELVIPRPLRAISPVLLGPLYYWRKRLYRHARAVTAVANDYLSVARKLTKGREVLLETIYWGYPGEVAGSRADERIDRLVRTKKPGDIWIVYAGTLGENYDLRSILDAAATLPGLLGERASFRIVIAGDGPLKTLCERSAGQHLTFAGRLSAAELPVLYRHCDIALSTYKGQSTVAMPIKAFDYIAHGLPVVNSLGKDFGALVEQQRIGLNYDPESPRSLCNALAQLVNDRALRDICSNNALRLAAELTAARQYQKFVRLIDRLQTLNVSSEPSAPSAE